jgi:VanZ family protein
MAFYVLECPCHEKRTIRHYNTAMTSALFFRSASVVVLIAIWILSFLPGSGMPSVPGNDKWHHAIAYFACMFFWAQCYTRPLPRLKLAIGFILMGAAIEYLQGMTDYRSFEWLDMVADAIGVMLAWFVVTVQLSIKRRYSGDGEGRSSRR